MAGYIFTIASDQGIEGVEAAVRDGFYASTMPNEKLKSSQARNIAVSVLADYLSMRAGDNVYFLSKRKIYGVGVLLDIDGYCKYKNYINANDLNPKAHYSEDDEPLIRSLSPACRWICLFEPEVQFFDIGVDMDEVLMYRPQAFRVLRSLQNRTFIKIDDEENQALKECIYLKNKNNTGVIGFSKEFHDELRTKDLSKYIIDSDIFAKNLNDDNSFKLEMMLEAALIKQINEVGFEGEFYDYVTHQVIASPFKPLAYIDKMDIFAYRFLEKFPGSKKPIEKYLVVELKKDKAKKDMVLQLMRYVDWISNEYASGDYSKIKAVGIAKSYNPDVQSTVKSECVRSFLCETHPNKTAKWNDITFYEYSVDENGQIDLKEAQLDKHSSVLIKYMEELGIEVKKTAITVEGKKLNPIFKINDIVVFDDIDNYTRKKLEDKKWDVITIEKPRSTESDMNLVRDIVKKLIK